MVKVLRYNQIKLNILHEIAELNLQVGDFLPSERMLAEKFDISMGTLRRALAELEAQSIIKKQHGRGSILKKQIKNSRSRSQIALIHIKRLDNDIQMPSLDDLELYLNSRGIDLLYVPVTRFDKTLISEVEKCFAVLVTGCLDIDWIKSLSLLSKPMVAIGSHQYSDLLPWVNYDWQGASSLLTRELIAGKAKRIGLLNSSHRYYPSSSIYEGYKNELVNAGLELNENWVSWVATEEFCDKAKDFIINQLPELDAVVFEFGTYLPFLSLCWDMGILPNKKLAVIGGYNSNKSNIIGYGNNVSLTVFEKNVYIVGAEIFLDALQNNSDLKGEFIVNAKLLR
jgi:DNA-binding transcriptional regulator YhcF (GntR family)